MEALQWLPRLIKGVIDFQLDTFSAGVRPAVMFIAAFNVLLIYTAIVLGWKHKPANGEALWVAAAIIGVAWIASDAYVFALSNGG